MKALFISAVVDGDRFEKYLKPSLNRQITKIPVDICFLPGGSSLAAFNKAIDKYQPEIVIEAHEDTIFSEEVFEEVMNFFEAHPTAGAIGIAGARLASGANQQIRGAFWGGESDTCSKAVPPISVDTLDSCFFAFRTDNVRIDEKINSWHGYAEDICIQQLAAGRGVFVVPVNAQHIHRRYAAINQSGFAEVFTYLKEKWKRQYGTTTNGFRINRCP